MKPEPLNYDAAINILFSQALREGPKSKAPYKDEDVDAAESFLRQYCEGMEEFKSDAEYDIKHAREVTEQVHALMEAGEYLLEALRGTDNAHAHLAMARFQVQLDKTDI